MHRVKCVATPIYNICINQRHPDTMYGNGSIPTWEAFFVEFGHLVNVSTASSDA